MIQQNIRQTTCFVFKQQSPSFSKLITKKAAVKFMVVSEPRNQWPLCLQVHAGVDCRWPQTPQCRHRPEGGMV